METDTSDKFLRTFSARASSSLEGSKSKSSTSGPVQVEPSDSAPTASASSTNSLSTLLLTLGLELLALPEPSDAPELALSSGFGLASSCSDFSASVSPGAQAGYAHHIRTHPVFDSQNSRSKAQSTHFISQSLISTGRTPQAIVL